MTAKLRRRQAGEGTISEYRVSKRRANVQLGISADDGTRYLIKLRVTGPDGVPKQILRRGFTTREEAAAGLRDLIAKAGQPEGFAEPSKMLTRDYLGEWLDGRRLAPQTMSSYRRIMRLHVVPHIGSISLAMLTSTRIDKMYRELETTGRADGGEGGLSAKSVRYIAAVLHRALADAVDKNLLTINPCDKAEPPPAKAAKSPEMKVWEAHDVAIFRDWSRDGLSETLRTVYLLGFATGARRGELLALRWHDVDLDSGRLSIRRSVGDIRHYGKSVELVEGSTKSGKSRVVDLDPETVKMLREHRKQRAALAFPLAGSDALVFSDEEGSYLRPDSVSSAFVGAQGRCRKWQLEQATKAAKGGPVEVDQLPKIRLHDIRHSSATILLKAGVHPKVVMERLGHSNIATTLQTYSHVLPTLQKEAAEALGAAIYGNSP